MNLAPVLKQRFFDANGLPLSGGFLYSYSAGTTTPLATYSNATGTTNANPVVLDSSGYADVWLDPTLAYKLVLKDSGGSTIYTVDNVTFAVGISAWNANAIYQQGQLVTDSSGVGLMYVSLINNNQNQALTNVSAWRMFQGNIRTLSANTTLVVTDELVRSNSTSGALTMTLPACATTPVGKRIIVKDVGTGGNTTSVKGSGTDLVDGTNTWGTTLLRYAAAEFENNGTSWEAIGQVILTGTVTTSMLSDGILSADATGRAKMAAGYFSADATGLGKFADGFLTADTAGRAKMADGFVTPAKIAARIIGISSAYTGTPSGAGALCSTTITTTGRPVLFFITGGSGNGLSTITLNAATFYELGVTRDGSTITSWYFGAGYEGFGMSGIDSPAAGSHTYAFTYISADVNPTFTSMRIIAIEL